MLNLEFGESIILEVRKHWFVFLGQTLALALGLTAPLIARYFIFKYDYVQLVPFQHFITQYESLLTFIYALWALAFWIAFFVQWTNYYLDVWYVTQKRIIDVDQKGIFHREVSNLRFDKIQDISIEVNGVIATMFNFGDIHVQTAAEDSSDFFMKSVRNPERVRKVIFSQHNIESDREH